MQGSLFSNNSVAEFTPASLTNAKASGTFFWLDLDVDESHESEDVATLLRNNFSLHPLAVDAAATFGQRARIDDYDDVAIVVTFGADDTGASVNEVHCIISEACVVTLHQGECAAIDTARSRVSTYHASDNAAPQIAILYLVMDTLIDSFFPVLALMDDAIDNLEADILKKPTEAQLATLFSMKRNIMTLRKAVAPQRDMISSLNSGIVTVPGMTAGGSNYVRNLYEHLIRIGDMIDSYRDLIGGVMDTHLSMVSNRLNVVMKQLAVIATVFMPLGFLTGFFGQNFAWVEAHAQVSGWNFLGWGLGPEVVAIGVLLILFKRRGWLGGDTTA